MSTVNLNGPNDATSARPVGQTETSRATEAGASAPPAGANSPSASDAIAVSDRAATVSRLVARARQLPEVRQERIEQLQARVQSGSYTAAASEIAAAIIKHDLGA